MDEKQSMKYVPPKIRPIYFGKRQRESERRTDRQGIYFLYFKEDEFEKEQKKMERQKKLKQNSLANDELREELLDKPKEIKVNN